MAILVEAFVVMEDVDATVPTVCSIPSFRSWS